MVVLALSGERPSETATVNSPCDVISVGGAREAGGDAGGPPERSDLRAASPLSPLEAGETKNKNLFS